ncbi:MAG: FAD-binding oxidoreductase [Chloroflexota bacterium]|nr:FAD-binding oxidoreductase [Chloroflexota bacterium]
MREQGLARFAVDSSEPDVEITPTSIGQLQAMLTEAHEAGIAVISVGGGTQLGIGNVPAAYDAAISLGRIDRVIAYEPADLTVTVEPGLRLSDLQELLATSGQCLPLDPPCDPAATIGGVLATNSSGPMRHAYGTARDWLIGARIVHADGASSKSGGRVVKNVAGYDMHKLHIGALGTLGVIAEATFKLTPLPIAQTSIAIGCGDARSACKLVLDAHDAGLSIQAAEVLSPTAAHRMLDEARWSVVARCAGGQGAIDRTVRELNRLAMDAGAKTQVVNGEVWGRWSPEFVPSVLSLRISVMPSAVAATIDALDRSLAGAAARISATVTAGLVRVQLEPTRDEGAPALIGRASEIAMRNGGTMMIDAAPVAVKRSMDVFGPVRPDVSIMKRLKEQFDPHGVLAPGRFAGRL